MASPDFQGTERYSIVRRLGSGAMGVVYEAADAESGRNVALKVLRRADPRWLYNFKQEFRALTDVSHPNLVELHELFAEGDVWFFTMELVQGTDLLSHVRNGRLVKSADGSPDAFATTIAPAIDTPSAPLIASGSASHPLAAALSCPAQVERLQECIAQLATGVDALHLSGKLHCDIKPSNVLVTDEGRVVLLDFGLVVDHHRDAPADSEQGGEVVGTPAYMSPEQAAGRELSPASDWYGVGVVLYEALTGQLPFSGSHLRILTEKQQHDAPSAYVLNDDTPPELERLCAGLLARDPRDRISGDVALRMLGVDVGDSESAVLQSSLGEAPLIARESQMAALKQALAAVAAGTPTRVYVSGPSGMGKTTVVRRFLAHARQSEGTLVLSGRCYERESLPYKAVDALVDALASELHRMSAADARELINEDAAALGKLFPVLWRVDAIAQLRERSVSAGEPQELRRRAFAGLRYVLEQLATRRLVVLFIDDLQWGDLDSAALLNDVLRPPDGPRLLFVGSFRSEGVDTPAVRALLSPGYVGADVVVRQVEVASLSTDEATRLAIELGARRFAADIAAEAHGSPYFVAELARVVHRDGRGATAAATLDEMLWARICTLPELARLLIELVAVAGKPVGRPVVIRAAGAGANAATREALGVLRAARLVRGQRLRDRDTLNTFHDRIRETVIHHVDEARQVEHHRALALALEATAEADPEEMAMHYAAAGDSDTAARYATDAAARAMQTLAFDRAAKLYRLALELAPDHDEGQDLHVNLGTALANAGRGGEAADVFLLAVGMPGTANAVDLKRRAAEQYMVSGHVGKGVAAIKEVLAEVGMSYPKSRRGAIASLLARRARNRVRGLGFKERPENQIAPDVLTQLDVCWSACIGLTFIDNLVAVGFQAQYLRMALRAGEPQRVALGYVLEAGVLTTIAVKTRPRANRLLDRAEEIARRLDAPHVQGFVELVRGVAPQYDGRWALAYEYYMRAVEIFRSRCRGVNFETTSALVWVHVPLYYMGEIAEMSRLLPELMEQGRDRGNHYMVVASQTGLANSYWLARDDVEGAREANREAIEPWGDGGVHMTHYDLLARTHCHLYEGDSEGAVGAVDEGFPALKRSGMLRLQRVRVEAFQLRARANLTAPTAERLKQVERDITALNKEAMHWTDSLALLLRAGLSHVRGDIDASREHLASAEAAFADANMNLYRAATQRRRGQLIGGSEGEKLIDEADAWMKSQAITVPARMTDMLAPGFGPGRLDAKESS